jgi:hypothetical protein
MRAFRKDRFLTGDGYRVSPLEYVPMIIIIVLLVLMTTGMIDVLHTLAQNFVFKTYPGFYSWGIINAAGEWLGAPIEGTFFLFIPIVWLFKLVCTIIALVIQLVLILLLAVGHLLAFLIFIIGFYLVMYFAPPALTIFLIVRACRNEDVGGLWLIVSLFSTILYYIMMFSAPWLR